MYLIWRGWEKEKSPTRGRTIVRTVSVAFAGVILLILVRSTGEH